MTETAAENDTIWKTERRSIDENEPVLTVSIHLNSFPSDGSVCGAQVFYPKNHDKRTEEQTGEQTSKVFADSVQRSLAEAVSGSETKEALTKNDIFLFQQIDSPIILVRMWIPVKRRRKRKLGNCRISRKTGRGYMGRNK